METTKLQCEWNDELTKITIPPPAYSHHPSSVLFSSLPPPSYDRHDNLSITKEIKSKSDKEEDSWSMIMQRPFYHRWVYLLHSWGHVLQQGKWAFCAFLFPLFFVFILIVYILPSHH